MDVHSKDPEFWYQNSVEFYELYPHDCFVPRCLPFDESLVSSFGPFIGHDDESFIDLLKIKL
jgi:hypothetical protein